MPYDLTDAFLENEQRKAEINAIVKLLKEKGILEEPNEKKEPTKCS